MQQRKRPSWFTNYSKNSGAPYRLFTFPFAGGGAAIYRKWPERFSNVEVLAALLPGREGRIGEPALTSMETMLQQLVPAIAPLLDRPYVFFGHSMGALIAFELTRRLARDGLRCPECLFVSAFRSPDRPSRNRILHPLSDREFVRELTTYGGIPAQVLEMPELLELMVPTLRADFSVLETYRFVPAEPVASPIVAFCGTQDDVATRQEMLDWRDKTSAEFFLHDLQGDHFFLQSAEVALLDLVNKNMVQRETFRVHP